MNTFDVVIIGGGIAGTSLGYHLAPEQSACVLDMESTLGYHTTGRSAATFIETYGGRTIRLLTTASRAFMEDPPEGFGRPLMTGLPLLWAASADAIDALDGLEAAAREFNPNITRVDVAGALEACPILDPDWVTEGLIEDGASMLDVHALHQGYIHGFRKRKGVTETTAAVTEIRRRDGGWSVTTGNGETYECGVVVNAAGAWGDQVAALAGVRPVGLEPKLRNLFQVPIPNDVDARHLPMVGDLSEDFYFLPEHGSLLCSPADELPSEPCDAKPVTESISRALEAIRNATTLEAKHVSSSWAGLRTFTADRVPIASYDDEVGDFFWLVGQGGYGIQTAPALSETAAAILAGKALPEAVVAKGLVPADLDRRRLDSLE